MPSELKLLKAQCLSDRRNIELSIYGRHTPMQTNAQIGEKTTRLLDETKGICAHRSNNKKKSHILSGYQSKFPFSFSTVG